MVNTQPALTYLPKKIQSIHNYEKNIDISCSPQKYAIRAILDVAFLRIENFKTRKVARML